MSSRRTQQIDLKQPSRILLSPTFTCLYQSSSSPLLWCLLKEEEEEPSRRPVDERATLQHDIMSMYVSRYSMVKIEPSTGHVQENLAIL